MGLKNLKAQWFSTRRGWLVPVFDYPRVVITDQVLMRGVLSVSFHSTPELWALSWQGNPAMRRNVTQVSGLLSSPENCSAVKWQRAEGIWRERMSKLEWIAHISNTKKRIVGLLLFPASLFKHLALRALDAVNTLNCSWNYLPHEASSSIHGIWIFSHDSCFRLTVGLSAWITCHRTHVI